MDPLLPVDDPSSSRQAAASDVSLDRGGTTRPSVTTVPAARDSDPDPQKTAPLTIPRVAATSIRPNTAPSSHAEMPLAPIGTTRSLRGTTFSTENMTNRSVYNAGSTAVPSRGIPSLGPDQILDRRHSTMMRSGTGEGTEIDWIVPVDEKVRRERTLGERLKPTLLNAIAEKTKYAAKAKWMGYALNIAIGLQVVLGSLVTALSVVVKGSQVSVMTAVLGGMSTVVASYLARTRGSNEPQLSITRVKDLEAFIRECDAFIMDHGHLIKDSMQEKELEALRRKFEELLGNANGERKLSPV